MKKYAVIGNPVKHSLSPKIHQAFAEQMGIAIEYTTLEAPLDGFQQTVLWFRDHEGAGCNVTLPFKPDAFAVATKLSEAAKIARCANCLTFLEDGSIYADNFDGAGLVNDLIKNNQFDVAHKKILILGAGGAARTILGALLMKSPQHILIANRTADKAIELANRFKELGSVDGVGFTLLRGGDFDLIIHATSIGHQQEMLQLSHGLVNPDTVCYDLSYGEAAVPFLTWAKEQGGKMLHDGLGMLVEQAALSFKRWHGVDPKTAPVLAMLMSSNLAN